MEGNDSRGESNPLLSPDDIKTLNCEPKDLLDDPKVIEYMRQVIGRYTKLLTEPRIPYVITIEIDAVDLDDAISRAKELENEGGYADRIISVVQKYRMHNIGTEWYNKDDD